MHRGAVQTLSESQHWKLTVRKNLCCTRDSNLHQYCACFSVRCSTSWAIRPSKLSVVWLCESILWVIQSAETVKVVLVPVGECVQKSESCRCLSVWLGVRFVIVSVCDWGYTLLQNIKGCVWESRNCHQIVKMYPRWSLCNLYLLHMPHESYSRQLGSLLLCLCDVLRLLINSLVYWFCENVLWLWEHCNTLKVAVESMYALPESCFLWLWLWEHVHLVFVTVRAWMPCVKVVFVAVRVCTLCLKVVFVAVRVCMLWKLSLWLREYVCVVWKLSLSLWEQVCHGHF